VIALSITVGCLSVDSENYSFAKLNNQYRDHFRNVICKRQYHHRRKILFERTEAIRKSISERLNNQTDVFATDSMPLDICKIYNQEREEIK